jgi:anti-sigma factor RsiW
VRCSFFEARLDAYLEGTLPAAQAVLLEGHVAHCRSCGALLGELRVIDALLVTARQLEEAPNFTFKVMADVRAVPVPHVHRTPHAAIVAAYLAFAWIAIASFFAFGGKGAAAAVAVVSAGARQFGASLSALNLATGHLFGTATLGVTATMSAILALDGLLAVVAILGYGAMRTRVSARAARSTEAT